MTDIQDILKDAVKVRWSGEIKIRFYFGAIKNVQVGTTVDMDQPVDMNRFKQVKRDPFQEVVGQ